MSMKSLYIDTIYENGIGDLLIWKNYVPVNIINKDKTPNFIDLESPRNCRCWEEGKGYSKNF